MDSGDLAKLKADFLGAVSDLFDESVSVLSAPPGPRLVETEPSSICVFEWSKFAGDPEGFYCGSKVGYASANMSLKCIGPHESMVCYDAMAEELRVYGDIVPERICIGKEVLRTSPHYQHSKADPLAQRSLYHTAPLCREVFRELLVGVRDHHQSHWQAVIDGFDHLRPPAPAAMQETA